MVDTMPGPELERLETHMKDTGKTPEDVQRDLEAFKLHGASEQQIRIQVVIEKLKEMQKAGKDGMAYVDREGHKGNVNFSDPDVVPLLSREAHRAAPQVILELGTAHGLGTLSMLYGAPNAEAITMEWGEKEASAAEANFKEAGLPTQIVKAGEDFESLGQGSVTIIHGEASDAIPALPDRYKEKVRLVYIDHPKAAYPIDLQKIEAKGLLPKGAVVIADNTVSHLLREGEAPARQGIRDYLKLVEADSDNPTHWSTFTAPSHDGSTISEKL